MTETDFKQKIDSILKKPYSIQIYLVIKDKEAFTLKKTELDDEKTSPELKRVFTNSVLNHLVRHDNLQIRKLSETEERENTLYLYDYDTYSKELELFKDFDINIAVDKYDVFDFTKDSTSDIFGYIIYLGSMEDGIVLFKKHYHVALIKRGTLLLKRHKTRFELVSDEEMLRLNDTFHLIRVGEKIYVRDIKMIEYSMGFKELVIREAKESVDAIKGLQILNDAEEIDDMLTNMTFVRKLSRIRKASPIFKLNIPAKTIVEFTKNTPILSGKFKYSEDGTKICLNTIKGKEAFIKLMNDEYLRSELTNQYYDALSKDALSHTSE